MDSKFPSYSSLVNFMVGMPYLKDYGGDAKISFRRGHVHVLGSSVKDHS